MNIIVDINELGAASNPIVSAALLVLAESGVAKQVSVSDFLAHLQSNIATTGRIDVGSGGLSTLFADGSAQLANGSIVFNSDGSGSISNDAINWSNNTGSMGFANGHALITSDGGIANDNLALNSDGSAVFGGAISAVGFKTQEGDIRYLHTSGAGAAFTSSP